MDIASWPKRITEGLKKYKYAAIVLLIGLFLMILPSINTPQAQEVIHEEPESLPDINQQLGEILSHVAGAGEVQVLLSIREGAATVYQTDEDTSTGDQTSSSKVQTVIITTSEKAETGLIRQINPPVFMGAVIVCGGGDIPSVRLAIIDAVSKVTGLSSDRISVLKMK